MQLVINGKAAECRSGNVAALLEELGMKGDRVAVELNCEIVPRVQWAQQPLHDGDKLEIVHFVGGG
ncbi:MAG: sulfur carrier protein ThiS [Acidobacteriota bacterium]|nr:sulfur carrier protein ThiS [Acidobacteriota bacterium]